MDKSDEPKSSDSTSCILRQKGNDCFDKFKDTLNPMRKKTFLQQAISWYEKAVTTAIHDAAGDLCAAYKNLAVCHGAQAELEHSYGIKVIHLREAARYRADMLLHGERCRKEKVWLDTMVIYLRSNVEKYVAAYRKLIEDAIDEILNVIDREISCSTYHMMIAKYRLDQGERILIKAMEFVGQKDFRKALPLIGNIYRPIEEAKKHANSNKKLRTPLEMKESEEVSNDIEVLEKDYYSFLSLAQGLQAYNVGLGNFQKSVNSDNSDTRYKFGILALDDLKSAELLVRGEDIELIAMVKAKCGIIYWKILGRKYPAKIFLKEAMDLSTTIVGNPYNRDWYIEATDLLQEFRAEEERIEAEKWENKRKPFLEELKSEIKMIWTKKGATAAELVEFLWTSFPPKHVKHPKKPDTKKLEDRKLYLKLCHLYHPDRVNKEENETKYVVLCEEITKLITSQFVYDECEHSD